ncbi:MAG: SLC13 family permease [Candidatus Omnitrophica bacterium]|nr:SLC13 family permease [Candidatus Omnitrophota bacterium]
MTKKFIILILVSAAAMFSCRLAGLNMHQSLAVGILASSVLGTLFFWDFRLSFAFLGLSILLLTRTIDIENAIKFASLEVILFLVGMMIIVGLLKESGFFAWIVSLILRVRKLTANKFIITISLLSAVLSMMTSEVVSIIFMVAAILEICDYFEVEPTPFIIIAVMATNIGSAGTLLGNPIGILIATKAGLTFEDFLIKALPLSLVCLVAMLFIVVFWFRKAVSELDSRIKELGANEILIKLISVPPEKDLKISLGIFWLTLMLIGFHHRFEMMLGLEANTMLLTMPLVSAGAIMIWKWKRARSYVEHDVEWWTLLFFMMLFAQAGTLKYTGASDVLAQHLVSWAGYDINKLIGAVVWLGTFGSALLDNVVLVAAFIPVIQGLESISAHIEPLWWALLFGGCLGGNVTFIGSTANIVALGILEKERNIKVTFLKWIGIGFVIGTITTLIVWLALMFIPFYQ